MSGRNLLERDNIFLGRGRRRQRRDQHLGLLRRHTVIRTDARRRRVTCTDRRGSVRVRTIGGASAGAVVAHVLGLEILFLIWISWTGLRFLLREQGPERPKTGHDDS